MRIKFPDKLEMADCLITVLEYARYNAHEFVFGPMVQQRLLDEGMVLEGDIKDLVIILRKQFPKSEFIDG